MHEEMEKREVNKLMTALEKNSSVQSICITSSHLKNSKLHSRDIHQLWLECGLKDREVKALCTMLRNNKHITELRLNGESPLFFICFS